MSPNFFLCVFGHCVSEIVIFGGGVLVGHLSSRPKRLE